MAKAKGQLGVQNRHIYTRASYLYQAAAYLATTGASSASSSNTNTNDGQGTSLQKDDPRSLHDPVTDGRPNLALSGAQCKALQNTSRFLLADMRAVSLKVMIRQRPELKRSICRYCDTLLIEGSSCEAVVENVSKGGRKPWADVLVLRCRTCGGTKRFPVQAPAKKQVRKGLRTAAVAKTSSESDKISESNMEDS